MKITDEMVEQAAIAMWCCVGYGTPDKWRQTPTASRERYRDQAHAALSTVATADPTREQRLVQYRCAALPGIMACYTHDDDKPVHIADAAEAMAHAMFAAERPAVTTATIALDVDRLAAVGALAIGALRRPADDDLRDKAIEALCALLPKETS